MRTLAILAMVAGLSGAFWYCVTVTLDDMTRADCNAGHVRAAMRPKPPSLAEQALEACERSAFDIPEDRDIIRRALERLQELESNG